MSDFKPSTAYWAETHEIENQSVPLEDYNLFSADIALQEAVKREGADWAIADLSRFGAEMGSAEWIELGHQANQNKPELYTHDRYGRRTDEVRFHPAYHRFMQKSIEEGIHSSHWTDPKPGAHTARAAKSYMMSQNEAGHGCPITMTSAAIPALKHQTELYDQWAAKVMAREYDYRNISHTEKNGLTIGMAMTEKQGGSDVRRNSTRAVPVGEGGPGQAYELVGHKYFVSAPMCDAFLVLAQAPGGLSCFLLPRWRPDGTKNPLQIQRLKNKMGNVSNASSETELRGALAWMVGKEGRGVPTIIDMVAMTRFDCMIGSSAAMRQGLAQVLHHCAQREAFGAKLIDKPLMQNVLADLAIESEAALALTMRMARSLDNQDSEFEQLLMRIGTAVGKYWICKRTPGHNYEAMECIGGSGLIEESIFPRLYREAPVNAIWEGSGNVQCLDMIRAMQRSPGSLDAFMQEIGKAQGKDARFDRAVESLQAAFTDLETLEYRARSVVEKMALTLQASLLLNEGDPTVAEGFCASRLTADNAGWVYGTLPTGVDCKAIIDRAMPKL